jgi:hypothetical protein
MSETTGEQLEVSALFDRYNERLRRSLQKRIETARGPRGYLAKTHPCIPIAWWSGPTGASKKRRLSPGTVTSRHWLYSARASFQPP